MTFQRLQPFPALLTLLAIALLTGGSVHAEGANTAAVREFTGVMWGAKFGINLVAPNGESVNIPDSAAQPTKMLDACRDGMNCRIRGRIAADGIVVSIEKAEAIDGAPLESQAVGPAMVQPSFDCAKATVVTELIICMTPDIATADVRLAALYRSARQSRLAGVEKTQAEWMRRRNRCATEECIRDAYKTRINELAAAARGDEK